MWSFGQTFIICLRKIIFSRRKKNCKTFCLILFTKIIAKTALCTCKHKVYCKSTQIMFSGKNVKCSSFEHQQFRREVIQWILKYFFQNQGSGLSNFTENHNTDIVLLTKQSCDMSLSILQNQESFHFIGNTKQLAKLTYLWVSMQTFESRDAFLGIQHFYAQQADQAEAQARLVSWSYFGFCSLFCLRGSSDRTQTKDELYEGEHSVWRLW